MSLVTVFVHDDLVVDYDIENKKYRVSVFKDYHFQDEFWFRAYEDKELNCKTATPIIRFDNYNHEWWAGRCPRCNEIIKYNFENEKLKRNHKHYCWRCGQFVDFEDYKT